MASPQSRPLCVLHLRDSPWVDGPARTILETGSHIDPQRFDYHIGALVPSAHASHPFVEGARRRGLKVHAIVDNGGLRGGIVDRIASLVDELGCDILHSSELKSNVLAVLVRRRRDVRLVTTVHGWIANDWRGRVYRYVDKTLLRLFDRVIFVSTAVRESVPRWWVSECRGRVVRNALAVNTYGAGHVGKRRRECGEGGTINVLNVGRLSPEKGQRLLLEAFAAVARERPDLRLLIAGTGPLEADLRALARALGVETQVEFLGYVDDMPALYARTDLVVQSSFTEGLPNVILEAAFLKVPILATRVGGTDEVVIDGRTAKLITPRSRDELEGGLREFLADPVRFTRMAERASEDVGSRFSFVARTNELCSIYEELH